MNNKLFNDFLNSNAKMSIWWGSIEILKLKKTVFFYKVNQLPSQALL